MSHSAQWSVDSNCRNTGISVTPAHGKEPQAPLAAAHSTLRFGEGNAEQNYGQTAETQPPERQKLQWVACSSGQKEGENANIFEARVALDNLRDGELLVPSFVLLNAQSYSYTFSLTSGHQQWSLAPVSSHPLASANNSAALPTLAAPTTLRAASEKTPASTQVSSHIDLFAIHCKLPNAQIVVRLETRHAPDNYLLVVSRRPKFLGTTGNIRPDQTRLIHNIPTISQMMQPEAQRHKTCSPTSLAMLMAYHRAPYYPATIDACCDPATGLYGVWPLNIVQAGLRGFTGAVELVSHWNSIANDQSPFIASISFDHGELDGAPLKATTGHLVVVCGTTETKVICNDPAAESAEGVIRHYDMQQFTRAWLGSRGAAYFIYPASPTTRLG